jgi:hypothetical protein
MIVFKEVFDRKVIDKEKEKYRVNDVYHGNKWYTVQYNSEVFTINVQGSKNIEKYVNAVLMKGGKDLEGREINSDKISKKYDVYKTEDRPDKKSHKKGTVLTLRLGKIISN